MKNCEQRGLAISAHCDDCAWAFSGAVAQLAARAQVDGVLFTDSDYEKNGPLRHSEELAAMAVLGMRDLYPVGQDRGFQDGQLCLSHYGQMVMELNRLLDRAEETGRPYTDLYTFGPDGYSGHPDHAIVANVAGFVFHHRPNNNLARLWMVGMSEEERALWDPNYFVFIPPVNIKDYIPVDITDTRPKKLAAIQAHTSQLHNGTAEHFARIQTLPPIEYYKVYNRI